MEDDAQVHLSLAFKWIDAPDYATDLSVYVFRPYGKAPPEKILNVTLASTKIEETRRVIVSVNSQDTLARLRSESFATKVLRHDVPGLPYTLQVFQVICVEITETFIAFMTNSCTDLNYMVGATVHAHKAGVWANLLRFMKDGFGPLVTRCNIYDTWKTATTLLRLAADITKKLFISYLTKSI